MCLTAGICLSRSHPRTVIAYMVAATYDKLARSFNNDQKLPKEERVCSHRIRARSRIKMCASIVKEKNATMRSRPQRPDMGLED